MTHTLTQSRSHPRRHDGIVAIAVLAAVMATLLGLGIAHRPPEAAMVLSTNEDCRRIFDDPTCRDIVERAQAIHATMAPSFSQRETCDLVYGAGGCGPLKSTIIQLPLFAPKMVAIAVTRDRKTILPLYYGPSRARDAMTENGRAVYFHGRLIGRFQVLNLAGADVATITDDSGDPLSEAALRRDRGI